MRKAWMRKLRWVGTIECANLLMVASIDSSLGAIRPTAQIAQVSCPRLSPPDLINSMSGPRT